MEFRLLLADLELKIEAMVLDLMRNNLNFPSVTKEEHSRAVEQLRRKQHAIFDAQNRAKGSQKTHRRTKADF